MKKIALLLLALCVTVLSCEKSVKVPLSYTVESVQGTPLPDIFIPDAGTYDLQAWVKFLTGYSEDSVKLVIKGLPSDIMAAQDSIKGIPTYIAHFILNTNHAVQGKYPVSIVATAPGSDPQTYSFNITVIPADCATYLWGNYNGANTCTARNYGYNSVISSTGAVNTVNVTNLGGYGTNTTTYVVLNCINDSLTVPSQNIGNGTVLQGSGTFSAGRMTIHYSASSTPGGFAEDCTAVLTKY